MNTNTFSDLSVCLMGLALNNVQNETTCKGKWKMTASFVIVLHNILLILFQFLCARYFSFDLEVDDRKYRKNTIDYKSNIRCCAKCLNYKCKISK